jgi:subtilisin
MEGDVMKILSFKKNHFPRMVQELLETMGKSERRIGWRRFDDLSCLSVPQSLFDQHQESFLKFIPHVEENVTVKVHAQVKDEIPWGVSNLGVNRLWNSSMGKGVKVAVIDTGISRSHRDLRGQVKGGTNIVKGRMGGHGTHVAGTIAAAMNNRGIVGVAPDAQLYDVRAFKADGSAKLSDIIEGIDWSIRNGMDVINMSFGMPEPSQALARAISRARKRGITMVASAGNNGGALEYPARYSGVVSVGALDQNGKLANFSARGKGLKTSAPGVGIRSTWLGNGYKTLDGTSMAAAHASGLAALRKAREK